MTEEQASALRDAGIEPSEWLVLGASYAGAEDGSITGVNAITAIRRNLFADAQEARREMMEHFAHVQQNVEVNLAGE